MAIYDVINGQPVSKRTYLLWTDKEIWCEKKAKILPKVLLDPTKVEIAKKDFDPSKCEGFFQKV